MKPKIVVLDGYVANPGDLSWDALAALGDLTVYDRTAPADVVARAAGADAVFTNKVVLDAAAIEALPSLRFIGVLATGYNNVDIVAARRAGIDVCNVPAYSTHSVAQLVFAHILQIANHVGRHSTSVKKGGWQHCQDFSYRLTPIIELAGLTMGIYGLGNIGKEVAKIASAFSMRVVALTSKMQYELPEYITAVDRDTLFREADILVLAAPLRRAPALVLGLLYHAACGVAVGCGAPQPARGVGGQSRRLPPRPAAECSELTLKNETTDILYII